MQSDVTKSFGLCQQPDNKPIMEDDAPRRAWVPQFDTMSQTILHKNKLGHSKKIN
jgi:hypothetical protein